MNFYKFAAFWGSNPIARRLFSNQLESAGRHTPGLLSHIQKHVGTYARDPGEVLTATLPEYAAREAMFSLYRPGSTNASAFAQKFRSVLGTPEVRQATKSAPDALGLVYPGVNHVHVTRPFQHVLEQHPVQQTVSLFPVRGMNAKAPGLPELQQLTDDALKNPGLIGWDAGEVDRIRRWADANRSLEVAQARGPAFKTVINRK